MEGRGEQHRLDGLYRRTTQRIVDSWRASPYRAPVLLLTVLLAVIGCSFLFYRHPPDTHAISCSASSTGNWSSPTTWGASCSGAGGIPASGDTITINSNVVVTVDASASNPSVASITFANPTTGANGLTISTGETLTVTGSGTAISYTANTSSNGQTITLQGTGNLTVSTGNVVMGTPTGTGGSAATCTTGTGTYSIAGTLGLTGNSTTTGLNSVAMGTCTLSVGGLTTLTGGSNATGVAQVTASTGTLSFGGGLTFTGTVADTKLTTSGAATIKDTGTITGAGVLSLTTATLVQFSGTSAVNTAFTTWKNWEIVSGTTTLGAAQTLTGLQVDNGATLANGGFLTTMNCTSTGVSGFRIDGTMSGTGGITFATSTGCVVDAQGAGAKLASVTGTITVSIAISIASTANISFGAAAGTAVFTVASGITVTNNGTVSLLNAGTSAGLAGSGTWTNAANSVLNVSGPTTTAIAITTLTASASPNTVNYAGAAQTCKGSSGTQTYNTLAFSGSGTKTCVTTTFTVTNVSVSDTAAWTTGAALTTTGSVSITGGSMTQGAFALTIDTTLTLNGGNFTTTSSSSTAFTVDGATTVTSGTLSVPASTSNKTFIGLVTVQGGTWSGASATIVVEGGITQTSGTVSLTGTQTFNTNTNTLSGTMTLGTIVASTAIHNSGSVTTAATTSAITCTGVWTQEANSTLTFTAAATFSGCTGSQFDAHTNTSNTVVYAGAAQTCLVTQYSNLTFGGTTTKTCAPTSPILGNVTMSGTTAAWTTSATLTINGNVLVNPSSTGSLNLGGTSVTLTVSGTTTVTTGTLTVPTGPTNQIFVGNVTVNGGTFSGASTVVVFQGGITQSIGSVSLTGTQTFNTNTNTLSGTMTLGTMVATTAVDNSAAVSTAATTNAITCTSVWQQETGSTLTFTAAATFSGCTGAQFDAHSFSNLVDYAGAAQTCLTTQYYNLEFEGTTTKTCTPTSPVLGNLTMAGTTAAWTMTTALVVDGNLAINSSSTGKLVTGNVTFGVNGTTTIVSTGTFTHSGNAAVTFGDDLTVNGTMSGTGTGPITAEGDVIGTGTITFSTASQSFTQQMQSSNQNFGPTGSNSWTFKSLSFGNASGSFHTINTETTGTGGVTVSNLLTIGGASDISPTILDAGDITWTLSLVGTPLVFNSSSSLLGDASTFVYSGNGATATASTGYANLSLTPSSSSAIILGSGTFTLTGNLVIGNGTNAGATASANHPTITVGGNLTVSALATFVSTSGTLTVTGNWTNSGTYTANSGSVLFNATDTGNTLSGTLSGSSAFYNLTFDGVGGGWTFNSVSTINNNLAINNGTVNDVGSQITGNSSGTMTMGSGATLNLGNSSATTFPATFTGPHITLDPASTVVYISVSNQTISSLPTYGNLELSAASGTPVKTLNGATTVAGNLTIDASNTLDTSSGNNYALNVGGNLTNNGTFTAENGTVTFNSADSQTVSGTFTGGSAFYNVTITNNSGTAPSDCEITGYVPSVSFAGSATITHNYVITTSGVKVQYDSGSTYTVANLDWVGAAGPSNNIYFRNSDASTTWLLDVSGTQTAVSDVNVSRSDASGGNQIVANDGSNTDCGNNNNWSMVVLNLGIDSSSVSFGTVTPGSNPVDQTNTLTTTSSSSSGYTIYGWSTQALTGSSGTVGDWPGTNSTPTTWPNGSYGFGYSTSDTTLTGGTGNRFSGPTFAGFSHTGPGDPVASSSAPVTNDLQTITYQLAASPSQAPANNYTTTIIYVLVANFP